VFFFLFLFLSLLEKVDLTCAPEATPWRKTRRDFHSIVPQPSCAWPERVALGTGITIIRSPLRERSLKWEWRIRRRRDSLSFSFLSFSLSFPLSRHLSISSLSYRSLLGTRKAKGGREYEEENTIYRGLVPLYRNTLGPCLYSLLGRQRATEWDAGGWCGTKGVGTTLG